MSAACKDGFTFDIFPTLFLSAVAMRIGFASCRNCNVGLSCNLGASDSRLCGDRLVRLDDDDDDDDAASNSACIAGPEAWM